MKKILKAMLSKAVGIFLLAIFINWLPAQVSAQGNDSKGTDFWVMFNSNVLPPTLTVFVASDVATSGTVAIPGLGFSVPFVVAANSVTPVVVPGAAATHTSNVIDNKGIHVTALQEVTVYGLNYAQFTTDAYLALPTDVLGKDYIIMSYSGNTLSELGVVATVNGTVVTITPSVAATGRPANVPFNITLNQGQTYELGQASDLTGTIITSTQPIGVMGANACANIPPGFGFCDHINEMLPPTTTWGKKFGTVPLKSRMAGDTWRMLASENATVVTINGVAQPAINRGQFLERILTAQSVIESTKPILVAQFANGSGFSGNPGDPFMMLIPSLEQFLAKYTVTTVTGYTAHFINVVAPAAIVGSLTLDGVIVPAASFTPIGASGFSGAQITVGAGVHNLLGTLPFGVFMYGFNNDDSYGYPGGQAFGAVATVTTVTLTPETGTAPVGNSQCFNALVKDQFNNPVPGVRVDFTITGANPGSTGFAFTNAMGIAQFCYTGANVGTDNIVASVGSITDASTFIWTPGGGGCVAPTFLNNPTIVLNTSCLGNDGNITIIPLSGTAPFMYSINGGMTYVPGPNAGRTFLDLGVGTYQLRLKDANGCESEIVTKIIVQQYGTPPTFLNNSSIVLNVTCPGRTDGNITIIPTSGGAPFMYSINGGMTYVAGPNGGFTFENLGVGTYQLRLKSASGCESAIVTKTIGVTNPVCPPVPPDMVGTIENKTTVAVTASPNPSRGQVRIQLHNFKASKAEVLILDSRGTVIQKSQVSLTKNNNLNFDLSRQAPGLYFIKVISTDGIHSSKVVLQR